MENCPTGLSPAGKPMTLKMRSSWSWWYGLLVLMSSWRQWNMGSDVSSSAKMQPIAQMSDREAEQKPMKAVTKVSRTGCTCPKKLESCADRWCCTILTDGFGVVPSPTPYSSCSAPDGAHHGVEVG